MHRSATAGLWDLTPSHYELDFRAFLEQALATEAAGRDRKGIEARMRAARFPAVKTREAFDFAFQPSIDRKVVHQLAGLAFVERAENRLDRVLAQLVYPRVLILDEIGYLPLSREDASLFFRLVTRRYERASLILTSNKGFADWGEVLGGPVMATAILDRLLHHATTVNIKGESYRLKEKRKAGLLGKPRAPTPKPDEEAATETVPEDTAA